MDEMLAMNIALVPLVEELKKQVVAAVAEMKADPRMANVLSLHVALANCRRQRSLNCLALARNF